MNTHVKPMTLIKEIDYGTPNSTSTNMVTLEIDGQEITVPEKKMINVRLSPELWKRAKAAAGERGPTLERWVRPSSGCTCWLRGGKRRATTNASVLHSH